MLQQMGPLRRFVKLPAQLSIYCQHRFNLPIPTAFHTTAPVAMLTNDKQRRLFRESYYRRRDHIADDYQLVYKAPMELTIAGCKHLASSSLAIAGACAAFKYASDMAVLETTNLHIAFGPLMSDADELMWFGGAFVLFNVAMLYACGRFPLRIYRNQTSYVAMFESYVPMSAKAYPFAAGQLHEDFSNVLPWHESMYTMHGRSVLLLTEYFKTPRELNDMMQTSEEQTKATPDKNKTRKY